MPWNVIIPLIVIAGIVVAIVLIKRKQDAPRRSFAEALDLARQSVRDQPDSLYFKPVQEGAAETAYDPAKEPANYGTYRFVYDDLVIKYQYERTTEFVDIKGDGLTRIGIQFIANNPTEVYLDGERVAEPRRFLEDHEGDMQGIRRFLRKHLKLQKSEKEKT